MKGGQIVSDAPSPEHPDRNPGIAWATGLPQSPASRRRVRINTAKTDSWRMDELFPLDADRFARRTLRKISVSHQG
jgi:hypothetical protein